MSNLIRNIWRRFDSKYNDASEFSEEDTSLAMKIFSDVQSIVERHEKKYKWHELSSNPNDLPPPEKLVLVVWKTKVKSHKYSYCLTKRTQSWSKGRGTYEWAIPQSQRVVAWKYFEAYESK